MNASEIVLKAVATGKVTQQRQLLEALEKRGLAMEQSSLSRLLKKLNVRKRDGRYVKEQAAIAADSAGVTRTEILRIVASPPNLLVVRTLPGHAHALGYRIDALGIPDLAGTVAGDDTMLIAVSNPDELLRVKGDLEKLLLRGY